MSRLDGIKNIPGKTKKQIKASRVVVQPKSYRRRKQNNKLYFFDFKQTSTIAITFIATLVLSFTTSSSIAAHRTQTFIISASQTPTALAVKNSPGQTQSIAVSTNAEVYLPREDVLLPDPFVARKQFLKNYLSAKGSPLAFHVDALSAQKEWKLIVAIAEAESSSCKVMPENTNNCWGIGGAWNLKSYQSLDQAIADVNRILETHYIAVGLTTPKDLVVKWVGHQNDQWQQTVQNELDDFKNIN